MTSAEEPMDSKHNTITEEIVENENKLAITNAARELNDCVESSLLKAGVSDLLVPSATLSSFGKINIIQSEENSPENPFNDDNFPKTSLDDECNSDMQDEEIQLRWDDDDDEISFVGGIEEDYINTAHLIKNEPCDDDEDEEFIVQGSTMEKFTDISHGASDLEILSYNENCHEVQKDKSPSPDIVLKESSKIKTESESFQNFNEIISTYNEEEKELGLGSQEFQESSETNFDKKQIEDILILKQDPTTSKTISVKKTNTLENIQFKFSEDVGFETVVEKHFHGLQDNTAVGEEKKILFQGIGLVESTPGNYNISDTVKENIRVCEGVERKSPLRTMEMDEYKDINFITTNLENSNDAITTTNILKDSCIVKYEQVSLNNQQMGQLSKVELHTVNECPMEEKIVKTVPEICLSNDDENPFHNLTIPCTKEMPKNIKQSEVVSVDHMEIEKSADTKVECYEIASIDGKEEREHVEKEIKLEVFPKQLIGEAENDKNIQHNLKHDSTSIQNQVQDSTSMQDSIIGTSLRIITQHGLKKPDMMLEIPTKELMNFMDDDDDDLDLLGNLEMSPDDAGTEIGDHDEIKQADLTEILITEPIKVNDLEKDTEAVAINTKQVEETDKSQQTNSEERPQITTVVDEPQPSTSKACMIMEIRRDSDKVGEVSDNLGLLAESTRVLEYDDEPDDDDYRDDEEDFDQDEESSNQMNAEYSEESNAVQSESDMPKVSQTEFHNAHDFEGKEDMQFNKSALCSFEITEETLKIDNKGNEIEQTKGVNVCEDAVKQTVDENLHEEDNCKAIKLPTGNEDDAANKSNELISQSEVQSEVDKENEDDVVLLEISSDEESCEPNAIALPSSEIEAPVSSEEKLPCGSLTETTEISSSDPNLDNKKDKLTATKADEVATPPKGLEVFNIDSDEDELSKTLINGSIKLNNEACPKDVEIQSELMKCVNPDCESLSNTQYYVADVSICKFYEAQFTKLAMVCEPCVNAVAKRNQGWIEGIRTLKPLLELESGRFTQELVEISDSESDEGEDKDNGEKERLGESGAKFVEEKLGDLINEAWEKFKMDSRLEDAVGVLRKDLAAVNEESEKLNNMLDECQGVLDQLRIDLYDTFPQDRKELPAIIIFDTPTHMYASYEDDLKLKSEPPQTRLKRRMSVVTDTPAKRLAVLPANSFPENENDKTPKSTVPASLDKGDEDNVDVSVVNLSMERAPADLPPPGDLNRPALRVGMTVYAMRDAFGLWQRAKVVEVQPRNLRNPAGSHFTTCRVRFEHKVNKNPFKLLPARCIAYCDPPESRLTIGTRIIASTDTNESYYSGVVAEVPNPVNSFRYLVFFDDGHAKYARHANTRLVCECSSLVWEEVHPNSRDFVRQYLLSYPERAMVRLHPKQSLKTEWNYQWFNSRVVQVDASLALIKFAGDRMEWIYRGSTRLAPLYLEMQAPEKARARSMPRPGYQHRTNMPYVEYTRYDEQQPVKTPPAGSVPLQQNEEMRRAQRAVARKSLTTNQLATPTPSAENAANTEDVTSRVVYYTPKNAVRPYKLVAHECGVKCRRSDVLALKDLRCYNPLTRPLLSGWERQVVRFKGHREVMYRAPCGRRLRNMAELHRYLRTTNSEMPVDLFNFDPAIHCLAEFVINKYKVAKKDLSHGKENVAVPCVNNYDETLPEFCSYNTERTPTAGVPLNLDPEFLCGCDCDDDCQDKTKCACWKMTLEGARTIGLIGDVGYVYRRLPDPLPSGIYECNSRCKCKSTCLNRVAQHPLQLKLQVFKTENRGWGIRALNDVPKGAFLCVYAGNLLTDATANLDGLNEGDEYLAELDYIEVVEQMKEGYEEDIPDSLKEPDKRIGTEEEESSSEEEEVKISKDEIDDDFQPGYIDVGPIEFNKRLRTRDRRKKDKQNNSDREKDTDSSKDNKDIKDIKDNEDNKDKGKENVDKEYEDEDCITISDDEEVAREPSRFMAQAGMDANQLVSKNRSVRSYFGKDEACYIMDAKVQGNIGRYLNHSCCPNVFVQNVFVDTHDPRFPWVAFFALCNIRAGTELTWNYNYDVGSVPGKVLYCFCGAPNCRGRLL